MKGSNFMAFLGGALVGGVIALLYAPQSGRETRAQIRDFVDDEVDQVKDFANRTVRNTRRAVNHEVDQVREGVAHVREVLNQDIDDIKSAVASCEGEAAHAVRKVANRRR